MPVEDNLVPHEGAHREVISDALRKGSDVGVLANVVVAAGAAPTKAEYDVLVASHNKVLEVLRDTGLIPTT